MMGCLKCTRVLGLLLLLAGILYLVADLTPWDFWGISWWTVLFVVIGFGSLAMTTCGDCARVCGWEKPKKK